MSPLARFARLAAVSIVALSATALGGCTVKTVDRPVTVTTRILPELAKPNLGKEVSGRSCSRVVLLIIPAGFATVESAYQDALDQAPGTDALVSFEQRSSLLFVFPFYYQVCSEVHGYAVQSKTLVAAP